ncbi:RNA polymerase sigma factor SigJ [Nocardioides marmotae]|nr:RNA polymerase sigma factor SigJ [Nocardioides marmotae]
MTPDRWTLLAMTSHPTSSQDGGDPDLTAVMAERRHLRNLAYRLLGSLVEAEDVVQETYVRWYAMSEEQRAAVRSPGAWLTTVAGRICLDLLGSARSRREHYVGEWVPEPLPTRTMWAEDGATPVDPADQITLDESVHMAFLVLLDTMTPAERVAFVLHDVFRYPFPEIAVIVGRSPAATRQLASSARRRIAGSPPPVTSTTQHTAVVRRFKEAWEARDIDALVGLLDPQAVAVGDGGGQVSAEERPVHGAARIAEFLVGRATALAGVTMAESLVNGQPGLVARSGEAIVAVMAFEVVDGRIARMWSVLNPDKLVAWAEADA